VNWRDGGQSVFTVPSQGPLRLAHAFSEAGTYEATIRVTDRNGGAVTGTVQLIVVGSDPPVLTAPGQAPLRLPHAFSGPGHHEATTPVTGGNGAAGGTVQLIVVASGPPGTPAIGQPGLVVVLGPDQPGPLGVLSGGAWTVLVNWGDGSTSTLTTSDPGSAGSPTEVHAQPEGYGAQAGVTGPLEEASEATFIPSSTPRKASGWWGRR
jgi:hypothetical protein